jgi:hypothetical protein
MLGKYRNNNHLTHGTSTSQANSPGRFRWYARKPSPARYATHERTSPMTLHRCGLMANCGAFIDTSVYKKRRRNPKEASSNFQRHLRVRGEFLPGPSPLRQK